MIEAVEVVKVLLTMTEGLSRVDQRVQSLAGGQEDTEWQGPSRGTLKMAVYARWASALAQAVELQPDHVPNRRKSRSPAQ